MKKSPPCDRSNSAFLFPKDIYVLFPGSYECVAFHSRRGLANVVKLKSLSWDIILACLLD